MIYLTYGIPKTASTYCYQMIRLLCIAAGWEQPDLPDGIKHEQSNINFIGPLTSEKLDALVNCSSEDDLIVVKTHSGVTDNLKEYIEQGVIYACASYRDPRDMSLSLIDAGERARSQGVVGGFNRFNSIEDTIPSISRHIERFQHWIDCGALPVYYERLCFDTRSFLESVCQQLSISKKLINKVLLESYMMQIGQYNKGVSLRYKYDLSSENNKFFLSNFGEFISECEKIIVKPSKLSLLRNAIYRNLIDKPLLKKLVMNRVSRGVVRLFKSDIA